MSEQKCRKVYVPVNLDVDAEGNIRPRLIRWIDGRVYEIDRLKHILQILFTHRLILKQFSILPVMRTAR